MLSKRLLISLAMTTLCLLLAILTLPVRGDNALPGAPQQTWPTRTSTPGASPTPIPGQTIVPPPQITKPPGQPTVSAVATTVPGSTATATPFGTAQPCGIPPTLLAQFGVNVRSGPGTNYAVIDGLPAAAVRPIVGRAGFAEWWVIQLADGSQGWVANETVTVQGYTANLPILNAPALDGSTPTPGPVWSPTTNPICTPTPVATATATISATVVQSSPVTETAVITMTATETAVTATPAATATAAGSLLADDSGGPATPIAGQSDTLGAESGLGSSWLLFLGLGLIVLGGLAFATLGRSG